jgi:TRAP-type C4-dicarboxylate transport system permease large subunit
MLQQPGVNPLHFGTVRPIAMGLGRLAPLTGPGLFAIVHFVAA